MEWNGTDSRKDSSWADKFVDAALICEAVMEHYEAVMEAGALLAVGRICCLCCHFRHKKQRSCLPRTPSSVALGALINAMGLWYGNSG